MSMKYTKQEFKKLWDSNEGVTFDDIADCAIAWGIYQTPRTKPMNMVGNKVLIAAGCEKFFEEDEASLLSLS